MFIATGTLSGLEHKTLESGKSVINATLNVYGGKNADQSPRPDCPVKISAFGDQADYIAKNFKDGDRFRMAGEPRLNQYKSQESGKDVSYVSYTVKAVMTQDAQKELYATINGKCKAMNEAHLPQLAPAALDIPAPAPPPLG
jgi:single-stranded DNA-binding protein